MNDQAKNVVVELPPGGFGPQDESSIHADESNTESFTMIGHSQAESSMSSFVHVPPTNNIDASSDGEWSDVDETTRLEDGRLKELRQVQQYLTQMAVQDNSSGQWNRGDSTRPRSLLGIPADKWGQKKVRQEMKKPKRKHQSSSRKKKQRLEKHSSDDDPDSDALSMIEELDIYTRMDLFEAMGLAPMEDTSRRPRCFRPKAMAGTLVAILIPREYRLPNIKLIHDMQNLQDEAETFLRQAQKGERTPFVGFKICRKNQYEDIQTNGFDCDEPGFHLCKTIENAISFWQFQTNTTNSTSSHQEHLWIVLGTEPPPSNQPIPPAANSEIPRALPLLCMDVECIGNDLDALTALVLQLEEWASSESS